MGVIAPLLALLGIELDSLMERAKRNAVAFALIGAFGLICLVFVLVAIHIALGYWIGPLWSAVALAGAFALAAAIVYARMQAIEKARKRRVIEKRKATDTTTLMTTAGIAALPMLIKNPAIRVAAIPVGAILGYLLLERRRNKVDPVD